ncbi:efflux RND transporter permease subunit [Candidatus Roizmanbacteria bacterium]|nr:efflux RND transporter permease subunit [Candidatus Roizmanbacteria bacterium]
MSEVHSYFEKLSITEKLRHSLVAKYLKQVRFMILLVLGIIIVGLASYFSIPRVLNPNIKIPIVIVSTVLPGAGPKDVESLVTIPLEDSLSGIARITKTTSTSTDSFSSIVIQFETGVDPDKARSDVQSAVDGVTLPTDTQSPKVQKLDFQNTPVWTFAVTSKYDNASLMRFATNLKKSLENIPSVDRVEIGGLETQQIQVLVKPEAISTYNLSPPLLASAIKSSVNALPAGTIHTQGSTFGLSIDPTVSSISELRDIRTTVNGTVVTLSDIADVSERAAPDQSPAFLATQKDQAQRVVTFDVYKTSTSNIDKAVTDASTEVYKSLNQYKGQFTLYDILNYSKEIDNQFNDLLADFWLTIGLIFITLFAFLGARQAVVAAVTTPLTFLIVFLVMNLAQIDISFIALFSLLLALGLLVDDTIVVISAMTAYHRTNRFTPYETGILVWKDFFTPIFTTTITTVWAFLPLLLASGIIGEFIKPIPIVVSTALLASIGVAMLITLPLIILILKPQIPFRVIMLIRLLLLAIIFGIFWAIIPKSAVVILLIMVFAAVLFVTYTIRHTISGEFKKRFSLDRLKPIIENGVISFQPLSNGYHKFIERILESQSARRKTVVMVIIFTLFSYILLPLGFVVNEFFPKSEADYVYVQIELPAGTSLEKASGEALRVLDDLRKTPGIRFVTTNLGRTASSSVGGSPGVNNILFTLSLEEKEHRKINSIKVGDYLREKYTKYTAGTLSVAEESGGPPAGSDLQINLYGDDLTVIDQYANQISAYLAQQSGVTNVSKSISAGTSKIRFIPDKQKIQEAGISLDQVGLWLRTFASGFTATSVKFNNAKDSEDVVIRMSPNSQTPEQITSLIIPTQGNGLPISQLGMLGLEPNPTLITREDGKRTMSVTATVTKGYTTTTLNQNLEKFANSIQLPQGYSWKTGGANEENQKSVTSILQAMGLSFLLILTTMVIQFGSFRKALIVMLVIPLSISGVFIIFALTHTTLSFPALIGVLALFGIVVKNSILIVDKIQANERVGLPFVTSIADGAASRLEPIALTSMTAIIGLIPVTLSNPIWRGLGGAIISGLTFSGTVMLLFIPVVYYAWFQKKEKVKSSRQ